MDDWLDPWIQFEPVYFTIFFAVLSDFDETSLTLLKHTEQNS